MLKRTVMIASLLACAGSWTAALAGPTEMTPFAAWRFEFGGTHGTFRPALNLGLRPQMNLDGVKPELISMSFTPTQFLAHIAGMPLAQRNFRLDQNDEAAPAAPAEESPWYSGKWLWGAGALAAAGVAVLATSGGGNKDNNTSSSSTRNGVVVADSVIPPSGICVTRGTPPFPDTCVFLTAREAGDFNAAIVPMDDGAGSMGDLFPR